MKLSDLCRSAGISFPAEQGNTEIASIVTDSRLAVRGSLYICIKGLHTDGHSYIGEAVARGAVCVLVQEGCVGEFSAAPCTLSHPNTRRASAELYNAFYGDPAGKLKFIGVTGTNGKTSVTHILRAILEASLYKCGLIGTVGCESAGKYLEPQTHDPSANMTTPDPPELYRMLSEMVRDGVEYVLMEVTSHALALEKLSPIRFEAGIFTNLTPEHLDFHGSMENYAAAKAKLFERCKISILNADSIYLPLIQKRVRSRVVTCSFSSAGETYHAEKIRMNGQLGVDYELVSSHA
ncbi:MAG: UDP-N-acetylmuramoyl-L-alanyl-D-glutamate--2,6-diaminopimelate ligase, partial [Clostridia bacterium]|nr:UDP-N-acetylmuramoyl-L-alanyl-D-glutamate--2,6-diaminopimelate ligase [Clostridia bacterium]